MNLHRKPRLRGDHRAVQIAAAWLLVSLAATSCARGPQDLQSPLLPEGGASRIEYLDAVGPTAVVYRFHNDTGAALAAPIVEVSCSCMTATFTPSDLPPGEVGTLTVQTKLEARGVEHGSARVTWRGRWPTNLDWTLALSNFRGLRVSPSILPGLAAERAKDVPLTFLVSGPGVRAQRNAAPDLTATLCIGDHHQSLAVQWGEEAGVDLLTGQLHWQPDPRARQLLRESGARATLTLCNQTVELPIL